jgi:ADP-heptose:LPS heptosyltransferase
MKILLALSSRKLRNGKPNPKNYPFGVELVKLMKKTGMITVQVRTQEEEVLPTDEVYTDASLEELKNLINECDTFVTVDNFIQHYAVYLGKKGVVIFSKSDPKHFGYPQNINLVKNKDYFRKYQFQTWEEDEFVQEAFIGPEVVVSAIHQFSIDQPRIVH